MLTEPGKLRAVRRGHGDQQGGHAVQEKVPPVFPPRLAKKFDEIAARAVRLESRTNLLFSFEKMAIRDAVKTGARDFSTGLVDFVYGKGSERAKFERWADVVGSLPRKQTRVLTWPLATVFGFIAVPDRQVILSREDGEESGRRIDPLATAQIPRALRRSE